jgi:site-specific recombinase XerD
MTTIAATVQAFFTDRLITQRHASPHTIAAYRDTVRMLLTFTTERSGIPCHLLEFTNLDAEAIAAFLDYLEHQRHNSVRTRNARLAAIHSLFGFATPRCPEHAAEITRVLAIPTKRTDHAIVDFLTDTEADALTTAPDRSTRTGRRDHTLIVLAIQTGLRATELVTLTRADVHLGTGAHVHCRGKGRKDRATPLTADTTQVLHTWLAEHTGSLTDPLFPSNRGGAMSLDAIEQRLTHHAHTAQKICPTLARKKITPHTLRHTAAMRLLHAGVDTTVIALWLGHESVETTQIYLRADLTLKERALARTTPLPSRPGRYRAPDPLLAFLESL